MIRTIFSSVVGSNGNSSIGIGIGFGIGTDVIVGIRIVNMMGVFCRRGR